MAGMTLMSRVGCFVIAVAAVCGAHADERRPIERGVGQAVKSFTLPDTTRDAPFDLDRDRGKAATVLVFLGTDCPLGNLYMPRLNELAKSFAPRGVVLVGINANVSESVEAIQAHAREYGATFPVLRDADGRVADQLEAERTCEALVIDGAGVLRYRGAIDDQYAVGVRRAQAQHAFVSEALEAILAGRAIDTKATSVEGCPIERPSVAGPKAARIRPAPESIVAAYKEVEGDTLPEVGTVNYAEHVAPILRQRCQECHRPGQVGPFTLLSYDDARRWAAGIWEVVDDRRMPPWHADPRFGKFDNDRHLTPRERATLIAWVEQDCPRGDVAKDPGPASFPEGWTVGKPDVVITLPEAVEVPAEGVMPYQYYRVPSGFTEDVWVEAAEARPSDRAVVHHIIVYVDEKRQDDRGRPVMTHLCGYAPGDLPSVYGNGIAKRIPAGSEFVFQMHYTPMGKIRTDRSMVGLTFAKGPVERQAITRPIANERLEIPPHDANHEVVSRFTFREDSTLLAFMPHMHLRGKDFLYRAKFPDGQEETLLSVPAYDFNWQSYYRLAEPRKMPRGTEITCVAHFDNSAGNPWNPDPGKRVRWGDQTWEEMMIGYIDYVPDAPVKPLDAERPRASTSTRRLLLQQAAKRLMGRRGNSGTPAASAPAGSATAATAAPGNTPK